MLYACGELLGEIKAEQCPHRRYERRVDLVRQLAFYGARQIGPVAGGHRLAGGHTVTTTLVPSPTWDVAIHRYVTGVPVETICSDAGISRSTLYRALDERGVERRHPPTAIDTATVARLAAQGLNASQIARRLGTRPNRIQRVAAAAGVPLARGVGGRRPRQLYIEPGG